MESIHKKRNLHLLVESTYRYSLLKGDIQIQCRDLLVQICDSENIQILKGVVRKDHVHMRVECPPSLCMSSLVKKLKGRSSQMLQKEFSSHR